MPKRKYSGSSFLPQILVSYSHCKYIFLQQTGQRYAKAPEQKCIETINQFIRFSFQQLLLIVHWVQIVVVLYTKYCGSFTKTV